MNLKITHNGFHGYQTRTLRGTKMPEDDYNFTDGKVKGYRFNVTTSGAAKFACRAEGCRCGERLPESFWIPAERVNGSEIEFRGFYAQ